MSRRANASSCTCIHCRTKHRAERGRSLLLDLVSFFLLLFFLFASAAAIQARRAPDCRCSLQSELAVLGSPDEHAPPPPSPSPAPPPVLVASSARAERKESVAASTPSAAAAARRGAFSKECRRLRSLLRDPDSLPWLSSVPLVQDMYTRLLSANLDFDSELQHVFCREPDECSDSRVFHVDHVFFVFVERCFSCLAWVHRTLHVVGSFLTRTHVFLVTVCCSPGSSGNSGVLGIVAVWSTAVDIC